MHHHSRKRDKKNVFKECSSRSSRYTVYTARHVGTKAAGIHIQLYSCGERWKRIGMEGEKENGCRPRIKGAVVAVKGSV
jgi:hypothetical protein